MPSPFPGMDPYLEGYLWPDVHHRLATQISDQLMPVLRPKYVARIEIQVVTDETPESDIGIMYPDVEVVQAPQIGTRTSGATARYPAAASSLEPAITPVTASIPLLEFEVRLATVEIRDVAQNQLVTSIEILSPVNKRELGLSKYRHKCRRLHAAHVHVLEIDLLRRGQRLQSPPDLPSSAYRVMLIRTEAHHADVWAIELPDTLPIIPVPLLSPDADRSLNLAQAFTTIYDRAGYDLSINYRNTPPPPAFTEDEKRWMATLFDNAEG